MEATGIKQLKALFTKAPTRMHAFLQQGETLIKLKIEDPTIRVKFALDVHLCNLRVHRATFVPRPA